jgi:hypothetical protein
LPDNGAQGTVRRLLVTHAEMLNEARRIEWKYRLGRTVDVSNPRASGAIELLHKLISSR